ncbi:MAG: hypothetical protein J3K34DRAFT_112578 [Monoraphidium minutum]|nr:MAG: hypothetical protein J3K34DRAFT_112578 [Monoraphidium minutum]
MMDDAHKAAAAKEQAKKRQLPCAGGAIEAAPAGAARGEHANRAPGTWGGGGGGSGGGRLWRWRWEGDEGRAEGVWAWCGGARLGEVSDARAGSKGRRAAGCVPCARRGIRQGGRPRQWEVEGAKGKRGRRRSASAGAQRGGPAGAQLGNGDVGCRVLLAGGRTQ